MVMGLYQHPFYIYSHGVIPFASFITLNILNYVNNCLYLHCVSVGSGCAHRKPSGEMACENSMARSFLSLLHSWNTHSRTHTCPRPHSLCFLSLSLSYTSKWITQLPLIRAIHYHLSSLQGLGRQLVVLYSGERLASDIFCSLHEVPHQQVDN